MQSQRFSKGSSSVCLPDYEGNLRDHQGGGPFKNPVSYQLSKMRLRSSAFASSVGVMRGTDSRVQHQYSDAARCHMATEQLGDLVIGDDRLDLFSLPVPNDLYVLAPMHWFYF